MNIEPHSIFFTAMSLSHHPYEVVKGCVALVIVLMKTESPLDCVAALSNTSKTDEVRQVIVDDTLIKNMREAYAKDPWCKQLMLAAWGMPKIRVKDGLWFMGNHLIIPGGCTAREDIFWMAHNALSHFGFYKTYGFLHDSYFWPNM